MFRSLSVVATNGVVKEATVSVMPRKDIARASEQIIG